MDPERTITWTFFRDQYKRLAFLPGAEHVQEQHWSEWYAMFCEGWFPFELDLAIGRILVDPSTQFFPAPGVVLDKMQEHRSRVGGRDWDSTLAALEAEHRGEAPPAVEAHSDEPNVKLLRSLGFGPRALEAPDERR